MKKIRLIFLLLFTFVYGNHCIKGLKILGLFPLQMKSHFVMCERLAKELAAKGHQIDVYSNFPLKYQIANYTDYSFVSPLLTNNVEYKHISNWKSSNLLLGLEKLGDSMCELLDTPVFRELFERVKKKQPYDVILIEVSVANCLLAWGRYLSIPMIGIMTSTLKDWYNEPLGNPYNTAVYPMIWSEFSHTMSFWQRLANTYLYYKFSADFKSIMSKQSRYVENFFGPGYPDASDLLKDLDLLLVNTHHSIDGVKAFTPAVIPVGGLHVHDDGEKLPGDVQDWLDEGTEGCIYMSFGSMTRIETMSKKILDAFYETFKRIAPVRVLLKIAKPDELPSGLPSNVKTQSWFPQYQVLKHKNIKVFVTHGGLMGVQESLSAGVPMIGIPLFGDQFVNMKFQASRNVARVVNVKDIDADKLITTVNEMLSNPLYKEKAEKYSRDFYDRPMSPSDTAIFWIEYIARHGKQALKSPILDMPWWQVHLLDVYGLIILITIVAFYLFILITKKLKHYCLPISFDKIKTD